MVRPQPGGVENEVSRLFLHSEEEIFMKFYHNNYSIMTVFLSCSASLWFRTRAMHSSVHTEKIVIHQKL